MRAHFTQVSRSSQSTIVAALATSAVAPVETPKAVNNWEVEAPAVIKAPIPSETVVDIISMAVLDSFVRKAIDQQRAKLVILRGNEMLETADKLAKQLQETKEVDQGVLGNLVDTISKTLTENNIITPDMKISELRQPMMLISEQLERSAKMSQDKVDYMHYFKLQAALGKLLGGGDDDFDMSSLDNKLAEANL